MKRFSVCTLLLAICSALFVWKVFIEDYGPFDGAINFHSTVLLDRQRLGYGTLPAYHPGPAGGGGYFDLYSNTITRSSRFVDTCVYDAPYWPGGDPGLGARNPLPPLVERHTIRAISPIVPGLVLMTGWTVWTVSAVRKLARPAARERGFDVINP